MAHPVALIPGIGPEVTGATRRVLEATGVETDEVASAIVRVLRSG